VEIDVIGRLGAAGPDPPDRHDLKWSRTWSRCTPTAGFCRGAPAAHPSIRRSRSRHIAVVLGGSITSDTVNWGTATSKRGRRSRPIHLFLPRRAIQRPRRSCGPGRSRTSCPRQGWVPPPEKTDGRGRRNFMRWLDGAGALPD
jgi:hypothetical protein